MKYIVDIPNDSINKYVSLLDKESFVVPITVGSDSSIRFNTGLKLKPYAEPDHKAIEDEVWQTAIEIDRNTGNYDWQGMTYREAKVKYEAWKKQKDEIHVGDEVVYSSNLLNYHGVKGVVLSPETDDEYAMILLLDDLNVVADASAKLKKTGRHFDEVEELLKKMEDE